MSHHGHGERTRAKPNAKAPLGQGGRFAALKQSIAGRSKVRNPGAAFIGRKKYGKAKFQALAAAGRRGGMAERKASARAKARGS